MNDNQSANPEGKVPEDIDNKKETTPDPHTVIEKLVSENAELKERALRALAETENMRRRSEREAADARTYAVTAFARDLLSVVDNLERAIGSLSAEQRAGGGDVVKGLVEGVELTSRDLTSVLGAPRRQAARPAGREVRPELPSGHVRGAERHRSLRGGLRGGAERLEDRRARAAPGFGRRLQGRGEDGALTLRRG